MITLIYSRYSYWGKFLKLKFSFALGACFVKICVDLIWFPKNGSHNPTSQPLKSVSCCHDLQHTVRTKLFPHYLNLNFEVEFDKVVNGIDQFVNEIWIFEWQLSGWRPTNFERSQTILPHMPRFAWYVFKIIWTFQQEKIRKEHSLK